MLNLSVVRLRTQTDAPICCFMNDVCGYSLKEAIVIVAVTSIIVSIAALVCSVCYVMSRSDKEIIYNLNSGNAINLLTALVCISTSLYEIVISVLMLWFLRWKRTVLLIKLWDGSNLTLLTLFFFLIGARAVIFYGAEEYMAAFCSIMCGVIYEGVFTYFCIIVRNYEGSLDPDTIYL